MSIIIHACYLVSYLKRPRSHARILVQCRRSLSCAVGAGTQSSTCFLKNNNYLLCGVFAGDSRLYFHLLCSDLFVRHVIQNAPYMLFFPLPCFVWNAVLNRFTSFSHVFGVSTFTTERFFTPVCQPLCGCLCACGFTVGVADRCLLEEDEQHFDLKTAKHSQDTKKNLNQKVGWKKNTKLFIQCINSVQRLFLISSSHLKTGQFVSLTTRYLKKNYCMPVSFQLSVSYLQLAQWKCTLACFLTVRAQMKHDAEFKRWLDCVCMCDRSRLRLLWTDICS